MKLGVLTVVLADKNFEDTCAYLSERGVQCVEVGAGGFPGKAHFDPEILLNDEAKIEAIKETLKKNNLTISGISAHGNPVHPDKEIAEKFDTEFKNAILLAEKLGVDTVVGFSGCPGGSKRDKTPNWVTCPWPDDFTQILEYQWKKVLIPYWKKTAAFAKEHGIKKIALELHPGFCCYNPETLLKLRAAVGDIITANFDPSHLFWQGIDPVAAIKKLEGAIGHFHAKDTKIDAYNCAVNGVLDTKSYSDVLNRSWSFRTIGYGHDDAVWKDIISALRVTGYDGAISIEHEDGLMSNCEGLNKAIDFLKDVLVFEDKGVMYWA